MRVFVVGADSTIGGALQTRLRADGVSVAGSTRRAAHVSGDIVHLDLGDLKGAVLPDADAVVICAAATSLQACRTSPDTTRAINVTAPLELARRFADKNAFVVALSTNLVFDGALAGRKATDKTVPGSAYGRQKAELEAGMAALGDLGAVVRLTKVISPETALLRNWRASLARGEEITPFSDMVMAPIPLARVVEALTRLAARRAGGIHQLSATSDCTYAEAALALAEMAGAPKNLVCSRRAPDDIVAAERPAFTSLDTARAEHELGWRAISPFDALKESFPA